MMNHRYLLTLYAILMTSSLSPAAPATQPARSPVIVSAAAWSDQNGDLVQLHGIGILQVGDTYYAYGQDCRDGEPYHAVATYSSKDLATWTRHEDALSFDQAPQLKAEMFDDPKFVVERPKVLFNKPTNRYVMLFHFDDAMRHQRYVGVAVCDRPDGRFTYLRKFKPQGNWSADMGVFVDPNDGQAYLIGEDRVNGRTTAESRTLLYKLNADYTDVTPDWHLVLPSITNAGPKFPSVESPTMVYEPKDKLYYVFGSLLTGWAPNDNVYTTTPSLTDPKWSPFKLFAPPKSNTFTSQVSFILPVQGSEATSYVFIADRWLPKHLWDSPPIFLPIKLEGGVATLDWHDAWSIDLVRGTWRAEKPAQTIATETAILSGGAAPTLTGVPRRRPTLSLPADSSATFSAVRVQTTGRHTLALHYTNITPLVRFGQDSCSFALISVNNGPARHLSFPVTHDKLNPVHLAVCAIDLVAGQDNTIEITAESLTGLTLHSIDVYAP